MERRTAQPRVRSWVAVAAHQRNSAGAMGKGTAKGRSKRDSTSRQKMRADLRREGGPN